MPAKKTSDAQARRKKRRKYAKPRFQKHGKLSLSIADAYY